MRGILKKIDQIHFGLMSPEQIKEMSVVNITRPDTYDEDGYPIEHGLMDSRLGVIDPSLKCRTCGEKGGECQGHFGRIELARPVIHVGFGDDIHKILRSTCNECGRVLLDEEEIEAYTEKLIELQEAGESTEELIREVYKICKAKKVKDVCPHCGAEQEDIKIVKPIGIIEVRREYDENGELLTDANGNPVTTDYDLTASEVREKLERIPDEDAYVLGVNPEVARPEWMVLTVLPVPPVTVRPSITLDTGERSEDDLTHKLVDILRINQRLIENMDAGAPQLIVEDLWQLLQYHVTTYFDNEASGVPPARHRSGRPLKTLAQRLKGKEGRFRSNLSGKRVNFSARTVISPDPNISINEVGVPEMIAKEVTVPTYVNEWNIEDLREAILNGPDAHPGANYVRKYNDRIKDYNEVRVLDSNKETVAEMLTWGDIVMRHLKDGDIVLFNRQPSLHRMSMMAHEVRVLPYKTFRLNLCVCPPYNADFDGDEMNLHVFQTDESRAEAKSLLRVQEHILSPRFGGPIIGAIHDHISGAYLMTRDGFEVPEDEAYQMIRKSHLLNNLYVDKERLKRKNRNWTGKELFSLVLPDDLNMNYRAEICRKCEECMAEACEYDAYVVIKDGQLTHGAIDEAAYGSFSGKILDTIVKEYGPSRAKEFLDRSTDLAICGIMKAGMTTSTNDEEIPEEALEVIDAILDNAEQKVDKLIETYEMGELQPLPGRSAEEILEMRIVQVLGEARDAAVDIAAGYLTMGKQSPDDSYDHVMAVENHSVVMAKTGARASMLNLAQITACVGQQSVRGGRITRGYLARPLPHFRKHELGAIAKGFIHSSYKEGLDPVEFFFHAMGGREGLVDTAIRTAQSGYMQRRLVNALEDLNVKSDGVVRDNKGNVIQTVFGEDGIDPAKSDFGKVANLDKLIDEMRINEPDIPKKRKNTRSSRKKIDQESFIKKEKEKEAKEKAKKEKAEKQKREREAKEKAKKEKVEKQKREREAREKARKEKAEKEKREREAREKALKEKAEREKREKEAREKALKEKAEREKREREAKLKEEMAKREKELLERERQIAEREKRILEQERIIKDQFNKKYINYINSCNDLFKEVKSLTNELFILKDNLIALKLNLNGFSSDFKYKFGEFIIVSTNQIDDLIKLNDQYLEKLSTYESQLINLLSLSNQITEIIELNSKISKLNNINNEVKKIHISKIKVGYNEQLSVYNDLLANEKDFNNSLLNKEKEDKSSSSELDEETLEYYNKFNEYFEKGVFSSFVLNFKFRINVEEFEIIKERILEDIKNQKLYGEYDFDSVVRRYSKEIK